MTRKRLKSVTWDLASHKLTWVVETGKLQGRDFVPTNTNRYEISPDEARMRYAEETRGFSEVEAANLHQLLDTLSLYCAESVLWWDEGQGEKIEPEENKPKRETVDSRPPSRSGAMRWAIARTLR